MNLFFLRRIFFGILLLNILPIWAPMSDYPVFNDGIASRWFSQGQNTANMTLVGDCYAYLERTPGVKKALDTLHNSYVSRTHAAPGTLLIAHERATFYDIITAMLQHVYRDRPEAFLAFAQPTPTKEIFDTTWWLLTYLFFTSATSPATHLQQFYTLANALLLQGGHERPDRQSSLIALATLADYLAKQTAQQAALSETTDILKQLTLGVAVHHAKPTSSNGHPAHVRIHHGLPSVLNETSIPLVHKVFLENMEMLRAAEAPKDAEVVPVDSGIITKHSSLVLAGFQQLMDTESSERQRQFLVKLYHILNHDQMMAVIIRSTHDVITRENLEYLPHEEENRLYQVIATMICRCTTAGEFLEFIVQSGSELRADFTWALANVILPWMGLLTTDKIVIDNFCRLIHKTKLVAIDLKKFYPKNLIEIDAMLIADALITKALAQITAIRTTTNQFPATVAIPTLSLADLKTDTGMQTCALFFTEHELFPDFCCQHPRLGRLAKTWLASVVPSKKVVEADVQALNPVSCTPRQSPVVIAAVQQPVARIQDAMPAKGTRWVPVPTHKAACQKRLEEKELKAQEEALKAQEKADKELAEARVVYMKRVNSLSIMIKHIFDHDPCIGHLVENGIEVHRQEILKQKHLDLVYKMIAPDGKYTVLKAHGKLENDDRLKYLVLALASAIKRVLPPKDWEQFIAFERLDDRTIDEHPLIYIILHTLFTKHQYDEQRPDAPLASTLQCMNNVIHQYHRNNDAHKSIEVHCANSLIHLIHYYSKTIAYTPIPELMPPLIHGRIQPYEKYLDTAELPATQRPAQLYEAYAQDSAVATASLGDCFSADPAWLDAVQQIFANYHTTPDFFDQQLHCLLKKPETRATYHQLVSISFQWRQHFSNKACCWFHQQSTPEYIEARSTFYAALEKHAGEFVDAALAALPDQQRPLSDKEYQDVAANVISALMTGLSASFTDPANNYLRIFEEITDVSLPMNTLIVWCITSLFTTSDGIFVTRDIAHLQSIKADPSQATVLEKLQLLIQCLSVGHVTLSDDARFLMHALKHDDIDRPDHHDTHARLVAYNIVTNIKLLAQKVAAAHPDTAELRPLVQKSLSEAELVALFNEPTLEQTPKKSKKKKKKKAAANVTCPSPTPSTVSTMSLDTASLADFDDVSEISSTSSPASEISSAFSPASDISRRKTRSPRPSAYEMLGVDAPQPMDICRPKPIKAVINIESLVTQTNMPPETPEEAVEKMLVDDAGAPKIILPNPNRMKKNQRYYDQLLDVCTQLTAAEKPDQETCDELLAQFSHLSQQFTQRCASAFCQQQLELVDALEKLQRDAFDAIAQQHPPRLPSPPRAPSPIKIDFFAAESYIDREAREKELKKQLLAADAQILAPDAKSIKENIRYYEELSYVYNKLTKESLHPEKVLHEQLRDKWRAKFFHLLSYFPEYRASALYQQQLELFDALEDIVINFYGKSEGLYQPEEHSSLSPVIIPLIDEQWTLIKRQPPAPMLLSDDYSCLQPTPETRDAVVKCITKSYFNLNDTQQTAQTLFRQPVFTFDLMQVIKTYAPLKMENALRFQTCLHDALSIIGKRSEYASTGESEILEKLLTCVITPSQIVRPADALILPLLKAYCHFKLITMLTLFGDSKKSRIFIDDQRREGAWFHKLFTTLDPETAHQATTERVTHINALLQKILTAPSAKDVDQLIKKLGTYLIAHQIPQIELDRLTKEFTGLDQNIADRAKKFTQVKKEITNLTKELVTATLNESPEDIIKLAEELAEQTPELSEFTQEIIELTEETAELEKEFFTHARNLKLYAKIDWENACAKKPLPPLKHWRATADDDKSPRKRTAQTAELTEHYLQTPKRPNCMPHELTYQVASTVLQRVHYYVSKYRLLDHLIQLRLTV